jgi:hypothetical protein
MRMMLIATIIRSKLTASSAMSQCNSAKLESGIVPCPGCTCPCSHLVNAVTYQVTPNVYCVTPNCEADSVPDRGLASAIFKSRNGPRMLISTFALSQVWEVAVTCRCSVLLTMLDANFRSAAAAAAVLSLNASAMATVSLFGRQ